MSNNNSDDKKKKPLDSQQEITAAAKKALKEMGIDPDELRREASHELMVPKMALVGVFETTQKFCEAGKSSILMGSGQALNVRQLRSFIRALDASVGMAEQLLQDYEATKVAITARETLDFLTRDSVRRKLYEQGEESGFREPPEYEGKEEDPDSDITEEELDKLDMELLEALEGAKKAIAEENGSGKTEDSSFNDSKKPAKIDPLEKALETFKTKGKLSN